LKISPASDTISWKEEMDDHAAIKLCQAGSADAYRWIVEHYQSEAMGHALAILRRREDAEDCVQEAFVKAYHALHRFEAGRPFYPWFYTILRNCCLKCLQRRPATATETDPSPPILADVSDLEERCKAQLLEQALALVSSQDRELITLKHLNGLSYAALAERLGIPPGTVMSRLYHARQRLLAEVNHLIEQVS
jgi:RNA polymerase sigma-70 factor (ECF subfamily)